MHLLVFLNSGMNFGANSGFNDSGSLSIIKLMQSWVVCSATESNWNRCVMRHMEVWSLHHRGLSGCLKKPRTYLKAKKIKWLRLMKYVYNLWSINGWKHTRSVRRRHGFHYFCPFLQLSTVHFNLISTWGYGFLTTWWLGCFITLLILKTTFQMF